MKKFQDWVNENAIEDMGQNKNMPDNKETLSSFAQVKTPRSGDKAYSIYHGQEYVGVLTFEQNPTHKDKLGGQGGPLSHSSGVDHPQHLMGATGYKVAPAYLMFPRFDWVKHPRGGLEMLSVGYDNPVVWDAKKGMFYAPADYD